MSTSTLQPTVSDGSPRALRPAEVTPRVRFALAVISLVILAFPIVDFVSAAMKPNFNGYGGIDYTLYMDATRRWLAGGSFYEPYQLAGPYPIQMGDVLYAPNAMPLFIAFTALFGIVGALVAVPVT